MATQLESAKRGIVTDQMKDVAKEENIGTDVVRELIELGQLIIPFNNIHSPKRIRGIGSNTKVKVNVNIGTSPNNINHSTEIEKLKFAHKLNADAVMDLSIGENTDSFLKEVLGLSELPVGTVPVYSAFQKAICEENDFARMKTANLFNVIYEHAKEGVDFMTIHAGFTTESLKRLRLGRRTLGIVSRGGSLIANWMEKNKQENPLYEHFDELLDIAAEFDVTLSLGDALRSGCIEDATDKSQIEELIILGELAARAKLRGVQVMIEGPGHIPLHQIAANIEIQKSLCNKAPFYVLGPVVCDIALGYDHITSAIGGSIAALHGADFLCYVTPAEHLRLPTLDDTKTGIIAAKIAAFSADLAKGRKYATEQNKKMARARSELNWEKMELLSMDPETVKKYCSSPQKRENKEPCSMCGEFCAIKNWRLKDENKRDRWRI